MPNSSFLTKFLIKRNAKLHRLQPNQLNLLPKPLIPRLIAHNKLKIPAQPILPKRLNPKLRLNPSIGKTLPNLIIILILLIVEMDKI